MSQPKTQLKEPNEIRVSITSKVNYIIRYCNSLLKQPTIKFLHFSAVGGAINKLVHVVEVLKIVNQGLYQSNKLATVSYQSVDSNQKVENQKLYPKMEVILSIEEPKEKNEGFQDKYDETERKKLFEILSQSPRRPRRNFGRRGGFRRGGARGRGMRRGGPRGREMRRGGFRGRGMRGAPRGGMPMRGRGMRRGRY